MLLKGYYYFFLLPRNSVKNIEAILKATSEMCMNYGAMWRLSSSDRVASVEINHHHISSKVLKEERWDVSIKNKEIA